MAKKKVEAPVEEVVQPEIVKIEGNVAIEASGDVTVTTPMERNGEAAGAKADMDELPADIQKTMDENKDYAPTDPSGPPVPESGPAGVIPKAEPQADTEGRTAYMAKTTISGSFNGRPVNLVAGQEVMLDAGEFRVFKSYLDM